jgi:DNA mismatch repair protein MutL
MKARPVPQFTREITAQPTAAAGFSTAFMIPAETQTNQDFELRPESLPPLTDRLQFSGEPIPVEANATISGFGAVAAPTLKVRDKPVEDSCGNLLLDQEASQPGENPALDTLKPLGQIRDSFILAVSPDGLWIIDQHVAHERVLFEKVLEQRKAGEGQRLLMPLIVELTPGQQAVFGEICEELRRNGFEVELFGARTIAVKTAPAGVQPTDIEKMLLELLDQIQEEEQVLNLEKVRHRIAASIACHAAIKINTPLEQNKMEWLLKELAKTECPMTCPHGRPIVLRYSVKDIQRAFKRI